ncbi:hypothetical protein GQ600_17059 [Phytophthora cactorum]|nr:hypothetical protein GQ600_17059 [Phytophthora cactorum]
MRQPCGVLLLVTALLIYGVGAHTNLQSSTRLIATGWRDIATSRLLKAQESQPMNCSQPTLTTKRELVSLCLLSKCYETR